MPYWVTLIFKAVFLPHIFNLFPYNYQAGYASGVLFYFLFLLLTVSSPVEDRTFFFFAYSTIQLACKQTLLDLFAELVSLIFVFAFNKWVLWSIKLEKGVTLMMDLLIIICPNTFLLVFIGACWLFLKGNSFIYLFSPKMFIITVLKYTNQIQLNLPFLI